MKPPFPEVRRGVTVLKFTHDPQRNLDALLRLSVNRSRMDGPAHRSLIAHTEPHPSPSWIERRGIDVLVAVVGGSVFGYLLGIAYHAS